MGLLDWVDPAREKFIGLLSGMPISQAVRGNVSVPGLLGALKAMPKFDKEAKIEDQSAFWNPAGMLGKIVWHGSPHKFDKFDASKIGTGEGAQAYGHGVYLADAEDVASSYAGMRPAAGVSTIGGKPWSAQTRAQMLAESRARGAKGYEKAEASLRKEIDSAIASREFEAAQEAQDSLAALLDMRRSGVDLNTGENLYKADLPDEWIPKMLDWDKPLKEQSKEVQAALSDEAAKYIARGAKVPSAGMIVKSMEYLDKETGKFGGPQGIAAKLKEFGVTGIRYLDGGSRGAGQGSYNYVVFPGLEDKVKILERNGVPLGLLGAMP